MGKECDLAVEFSLYLQMVGGQESNLDDTLRSNIQNTFLEGHTLPLCYHSVNGPYCLNEDSHLQPPIQSNTP